MKDTRIRNTFRLSPEKQRKLRIKIAKKGEKLQDVMERKVDEYLEEK